MELRYSPADDFLTEMQMKMEMKMLRMKLMMNFDLLLAASCPCEWHTKCQFELTRVSQSDFSSTLGGPVVRWLFEREFFGALKKQHLPRLKLEREIQVSQLSCFHCKEQFAAPGCFVPLALSGTAGEEEICKLVAKWSCCRSVWKSHSLGHFWPARRRVKPPVFLSKWEPGPLAWG